MYIVVPSPLGGMWLQNEAGLVMASGTSASDLRANLLVAMERRELSPFMKLTDEYGNVIMLKEYVKI